MKPKRIAIWVAISILAMAAAVVLVVRARHWQPRSITIQGAVIRRDADARKQIPISGATVAVSDGANSATTTSTALGYFKVKVHKRVWPRETLHLDFHAPGYHPLDMELKLGLRAHFKQLCIAEMKPVTVPVATPAGREPVLVSNVLIRYTVNYAAETNIGAMARTFQVDNQGNVPCKGYSLCSPDGNWRASRGSVTLDAGTGNVLRDVRASCIAGPCPFTRIDYKGFKHAAQIAVVYAVNWSDTATFLVEAEVFDKTIASSVRKSYPVIYGNDLHFTLPPTAEGPSIEADIAGTPVVFPLDGGFYINWTVCSSEAGENNSRVYECELRPGYRVLSHDQLSHEGNP
ncbi:MAG TPA: hypothetical protein VME86_18460 [Acidobacteriaceae bacterium]|nr:hypothetical protein [Acidobacteriaceae bacterium]